jgi:murein DD-endopeptidase MepM/ murein hydrolase activator NlpD
MAVKVKKGQTLSQIAKENNTTVQAIAQANNIADVNKIAVGQVLEIPGEAAKAAPSTTTTAPKPTRKPTDSVQQTTAPTPTKKPIPPGIAPPLPENEPVVPKPTKKPEPSLGILEEVFGQLLPESKRRDDLPNSKHFFSDLFGLETDHAELAVQQVGLAIAERMADTFGTSIPETLRSEITEENFSQPVLAAMKDAVLKAIKRDSPTTYEDFGNAANLTDSKKRQGLGRMDILKEIGKSFTDPAMAAAFSVGQSANISIDGEGNVWIDSDTYDFPDLSDVKDKDEWLAFNNLFGSNGIFSVRPENARNIRINLGKVPSQQAKPEKSGGGSPRSSEGG